jgi:hypothetical protein
VHHRLLVSRLVVGQEFGLFEEGLADSPHVAVPEDAEAAPEEAMLDPVALDVLVGEEPYEGLRRCQSHGRHVRESSTVSSSSSCCNSSSSRPPAISVRMCFV